MAATSMPTRMTATAKDQIRSIMDGKTPKFNGQPVQGHHAFSVSQYPHLGNKGDVVWPATFNEYFNGWHGGSWRTSLPGESLNISILDF